MNPTILLSAVLLASTPEVAPTAVAAPATQVDETESVRALLARLVPDDAATEKAAPAPSKKSEAAAAVETTTTNAMPAPIIEPEKMAHTTMLLMVALIGAFGIATLASKRRQLASRPLRRVAAESLGSRQQIVLVEALGEYLLVATGGREPVLLAQLDTDQAKRRLEAMNAPEETKGSNMLSGLLAGKLPGRKGRFESVLAEVESEPAPKPASTSDLTKAQAALRYIAAANGVEAANEASPPSPDINATLGQIAAVKRANDANKNDEIRRRLAAL